MRFLSVQSGVFGGLVVVGAAVLAACAGGSEAPPTLVPASGPVGSAIKATEVPPGSLEIDQDGLEFKPRQVETTVGKAVFLKNSETAIHTVNINGKNVSGNMRKGDIVAWSTDTAGTYKVTCEFHPQMKATITVK